MKKVFLFLLMIVGFCANAQTVNNIPLKELDVEYVQIVGTSKMFSNKVTIELDFGQHTKFFSSGKETFITDENGNRMVFNSMIDSLNYLSLNGFEFVQAYAFATNNQNVYHYLMKKKDILEK